MRAHPPANKGQAECAIVLLRRFDQVSQVPLVGLHHFLSLGIRRACIQSIPTMISGRLFRRLSHRPGAWRTRNWDRHGRTTAGQVRAIEGSLDDANRMMKVFSHRSPKCDF